MLDFGVLALFRDFEHEQSPVNPIKTSKVVAFKKIDGWLVSATQCTKIYDLLGLLSRDSLIALNS